MKREFLAMALAACVAAVAVFWFSGRASPEVRAPATPPPPPPAPAAASSPARPLRVLPAWTPPPPEPPESPLKPVASTPDGVSVSARRLNEVQSRPGAIAGEVVLGFFSPSERDRFVALARGRAGLVVADLAAPGNAVRLRVTDPRALDALLREAPTPTVWAPNVAVRAPDPPPGTPLPPEAAGYQPFGAESLSWLGVPSDHAAWGRGVVVAVIDSGVDARAAGVAGGRFTQLDWNEGAADPIHGTAVAAIAAGGDANLPGVAPEAGVLSIAIMNANGMSDSFTLARAILEAVERGARVINLSLGSSGDSFVLREAVAEAVRRGVAIVAAVGNDGAGAVQYPAAYDGVIAVGAVDALGRHAFFSNRGAVDLAAPGIGVAVAATNGAVLAFSGTSASAPFVSGALAYLFSEDPALTPTRALEILAAAADDPGPSAQNELVGEGILNLARVVERGTPGLYDAAVGNPAVAEPNGAARLTVSVQNRGTAPIGRAMLVAEWAGRREERAIGPLAVGGLTSHTFTLGALPTQAEGGLAVAYGVALADVEDARPANNARRVVLWRDP